MDVGDTPPPVMIPSHCTYYSGWWNGTYVGIHWALACPEKLNGRFDPH